ncbi:hypothetical protein DFH09DRAFT_1118883, partial [Mycena vulgaris]
LLTRLKANPCKWQPVSAGDKAELAVKFANAKKKPRKVRSDKKARDDDAEEDKEEVPKKKNRKGQEVGGEAGKRVEEEEEEEAPKRKKKKAKAAAADDDTSPPPSTKSKKKGASKPPVAKPAKTVKTKTPASRKRHTPEPDPAAEIINNSADDDEPAPKKRKSVHTTEPAKAQEAQDDTAAATAAATKRALEALMARRKVVQAEREAAENGVQKSKAPRHDLIIVPKPKALARIADSDSSSDNFLGVRYPGGNRGNDGTVNLLSHVGEDISGEIVNSRHLGGPIGGTGGNGWMRNLLSHTLNAIGALKIKKNSTETPQKSGGKRRGDLTHLSFWGRMLLDIAAHSVLPACPPQGDWLRGARLGGDYWSCVEVFVAAKRTGQFAISIVHDSTKTNFSAHNQPRKSLPVAAIVAHVQVAARDQVHDDDIARVWAELAVRESENIISASVGTLFVARRPTYRTRDLMPTRLLHSPVLTPGGDARTGKQLPPPLTSVQARGPAALDTYADAVFSRAFWIC